MPYIFFEYSKIKYLYTTPRFTYIYIHLKSIRNDRIERFKKKKRKKRKKARLIYIHYKSQRLTVNQPLCGNYTARNMIRAFPYRTPFSTIAFIRGISSRMQLRPLPNGSIIHTRTEDNKQRLTVPRWKFFFPPASFLSPSR